MSQDPNDAAAVLLKALMVCRGVLYSARTGDASTGEIERILESTGEASLVKFIDEADYRDIVARMEALPPETSDALLAIGDEPY